MIIGGIQKFSLIDYPGKVCSVIFTAGCNLRCGYCHNPELVKCEKLSTRLNESEIISFLKKRKGKLDAVSISGGEAFLQKDIFEFIEQVKKIDYFVKIDTNGTEPQKIRQAIRMGYVDYIAMDIKAPLNKYEEIVNTKIDIEKIKESIDIILKSGIKHEFRTTVIKSQLSFEDIIGIAKSIRQAELYVLQQFKSSEKILDESLKYAPVYTTQELLYLKNKVLRFVKSCKIRNN